MKVCQHDYSKGNDEYRLRNNEAVKKSRAKQKLQIEYDDEGPPDKLRHFHVSAYPSHVITS